MRGQPTIRRKRAAAHREEFPVSKLLRLEWVLIFAVLSAELKMFCRCKMSVLSMVMRIEGKWVLKIIETVMRNEVRILKFQSVTLCFVWLWLLFAKFYDSFSYSINLITVQLLKVYFCFLLLLFCTFYHLIFNT